MLTFAGVGLNTNIRELARAGWRPLVVAIVGLVVVALGLVLLTSRVCTRASAPAETDR